MSTLFNIIYFDSTKGFAKELTEMLDRGEKKAVSKMIAQGDTFSIDCLGDNAVPCNVLLLSEKDTPFVEPLLPEQKKKELSNNLLLICINVSLSTIEFLVNTYTNVVVVGESTEHMRMEIIDFYRKISRSNSIVPFVGRTQEIEQFQNLLYSERYLTTKSVVISGHTGVGREAFARECIRLSAGAEDKEPCLISMAENGNVEIFIVQLNSILQHYDEIGIKELLGKENDEKVKAAVTLLNKLFLFGRYVIVYDDAKTCIRYDRKLADWFKEIIGSPDLTGRMHLYVISTISINFSRAKVQDGAAFFTLYDLSRSDRKKLIYHRLSELKTVAPEEDVNYILESSIYSPQILIRIVDDYCEDKHGLEYVKSQMDEYLAIEDRKLRQIIQKYKDSPETDLWNLLVLLSQIEYLSKDVLNAIFEETFDFIQRHLETLTTDGIIERFGEMDEYYRLDSSISDNMRRNRDKYKEPFFQNHVDEVMADVISRNPKITEDYSIYLYKVKKDIHSGRKDSDALLIPSIVISSIIATYESRTYDKTVELCDWILEEKPHYFEDVYREIRYWKCLALARLTDKRFYECVDYFKYNADYHFLMGFMYRLKKEYGKAEAEFRAALRQNPSFGRAKRELVIALLGQHKFSDALDLAKENYERDSENTYHLLAYYRCLVRKYGLSSNERQKTEELLKEAKNLFSSEYYYEGMQFEYDRFVAKKTISDLLGEARRLELIGKDNNVPYLIDIISEFKVYAGIDTTIKLTELDGEFDK